MPIRHRKNYLQRQLIRTTSKKLSKTPHNRWEGSDGTLGTCAGLLGPRHAFDPRALAHESRYFTRFKS